MIAVSSADMKEKLQSIEKAVKEEDQKQIAVLSHYIKGAALTARYKTMAGIAANMELMAKDGIMDSMEEKLSALTREWTNVLHVIDRVM